MESGSVNPSSLFILAIGFAILGILHFLGNFRISLSISAMHYFTEALPHSQSLWIELTTQVRTWRGSTTGPDQNLQLVPGQALVLAKLLREA